MPLWSAHLREGARDARARARCERRVGVAAIAARARGHPFCMSASTVYVSSAPAKRSLGDLTPRTTGTASSRSITPAYLRE